MKMRQLTKIEQGILSSCLTTLTNLVMTTKSSEQTELLEKHIKETFGVDVDEVLAGLAKLVENNPLLVLELEGAKLGEIKFDQLDLESLRKKVQDPFQGLKGMKFPFKKDPGHEHTN